MQSTSLSTTTGPRGRLSRTLIVSAGVLVVALLVWFFSDIVWFLLISATLSLVAKPIVRGVTSLTVAGRHLPRWVGALAALLTLWAVLLLLAWMTIPLISEQLYQFRALDTAELINAFNHQIDALEMRLRYNLPSLMNGISLREQLDSYVVRLVKATSLSSLFASATSFLSSVSVMLYSVSFITFFFLKDEGSFSRGLTFFFPERLHERVISSVGSIDILLRRYFVGLLLQSLSVAILTLVPFLLLGLPFATSVTIAAISGLLNIIPYVGPLIALVISALFAAAATISGAVESTIGGMVMWTTIIFLAVRLVDNIFLQPIIFSNSASAHPLEVFIVLLMAGYLAGMTGLLLALPVYTVVRVFAKEFFSNIEQVRRLTDHMTPESIDPPDTTP